MALNYLTNAVVYLDRIGVTDVIIPFLLIFTVVFVALQKARVFGQKEEMTRKYSAIIALALALGVIISHVTQNFRYTQGVDAVAIINAAIPRVSILLIVALFFLILIGTFGYQPKEGDSAFGGMVAVLAILAVGYIFIASAGFLPRGPGTILYALGPDLTALIVVILIFGSIVFYIMSPAKDPNSESSFGQLLRGLLRGGHN